MHIIRWGSGRTVFVFGSFVIKVPHYHKGARAFIMGCISNIKEGTLYHKSNRKDLLCAVKWYAWIGVVLIMKRANIERHLLEEAALIKDGTRWDEYYGQWKEADCGTDNHPWNFGYVDDVLVKIDYGCVPNSLSWIESLWFWIKPFVRNTKPPVMIGQE